MAKKIYGIDLGTTYSCVAHINDRGLAEVIKNRDGHFTTPSVVCFESATNVVVGETAKNSAIAYPDETVSLVKRFMGKEGFHFTHNGRNISPEEVSSHILRKLVRDAEKYLNLAEGEITDVIITHPAYFGVPEREATRNAGRIAGLNVIALVEEPVAAAVEYHSRHLSSSDRLLVYDLGGGTFDVTLVEQAGNHFNVICTGGDSLLGGANWDEVIYQFFVDEFAAKTGIPTSELTETDTRIRWLLQAEEAKKILSSSEKYKRPVSHGVDIAQIELTRAQFDELTAHLLNRTLDYTCQTIIEAIKQGKDYSFNKLLLVGGSTRMPQVSEALRSSLKATLLEYIDNKMVAFSLTLDDEIGRLMHQETQYMPREKIETIISRLRAARGELESWEFQILMTDPDEAVAKGAALRGAKYKIAPVTSRSFGIFSLDSNHQEVLSNIIIRNSTIPCEVSKAFSTVHDNLSTVRIVICESEVSEETTRRDMGVIIGEGTLVMPPGLPKGAPLDVTISLNIEGLLRVRAVERKEKREVQVELKVANTLSASEVETVRRMVDEIIVE